MITPENNQMMERTDGTARSEVINKDLVQGTPTEQGSGSKENLTIDNILTVSTEPADQVKTEDKTAESKVINRDPGQGSKVVIEVRIQFNMHK